MSEFATLAQLTVVAMVPYLLASLGTMLGGLAGVFSVSQEGVMVLGAAVGFLISYGTGSTALGILLAAAVGAVFGFALGWATTALRLDQFVVGLALFFAATGLAGLLYRIVIGQTATTPLVETLPRLEIPLLSDIPVLGTALFSHNVLVYFAALLTVGLWFFLYRTRAGLNLRSVGENPKAADSLGIPVARTRLWTTTAGGALMAIAGAFLPLVYTGTFTEGIVGGRGWLAIALTFFGGWRPQYIAAGALFFATMDVVALRAEVSGIDIPSQVLLITPYVATLIVMVFAFRWVRLSRS
jgi:general nucleoside transport system permease protein